MRLKSRLKIAKIPRKKKQNIIEDVDCCDYCGKKFRYSRQRTAGSAACAGCTNNTAKLIDRKWMFFCDHNCAASYENTAEYTDSECIVSVGRDFSVGEVAHGKSRDNLAVFYREEDYINPNLPFIKRRKTA